MEQMKQGVDILAPFDGVVKAVRDGIEDINVDIGGLDKIKDQECGNGVVITTHDLEAQLCHMQKGSISVKVGDRVLAGERLGSVGLSGNTNHPHLYFALSKKNQDGSLSEIDPFYGDQPNCGLRPQPLWANPDYLSEHIKDGIVYNYGVAFQIPELAKVREGYYQRIIQPRNPEVIMVFADVLSVDKGHKMKVQFLDSEEKILFEKEHEFSKYQPKYFFYVGKNLHKEQIHGNFTIKITYTKPDESVVTYSKEVVLE
ncbi:MAG: M23 family metallopeptidase [Alphaproteobacteria bacterium]|nr:M23 family metallopeptidase [Alphaproteobacteria bacterium]